MTVYAIHISSLVGFGRRAALACAALCCAFFAARADDTDDNIIIDEEVAVYNLIERDGRLAEVKNTITTTFTTRRADGYADLMTFYNDQITIDKASAPDAKPIYHSWDDPNLFYDGSRVCRLHIPVKNGKKVKASIERTFKQPYQFCNVLLASPYFARRVTTTINVPRRLADAIRVTPYFLPDNMKLTCETLKDGSLRYVVDCIDQTSIHSEKMAPSLSLCAPQLHISGYFATVDELYTHFRSYTLDADPGDAAIGQLARELQAKAPADPQALADTVQAWVHRNIRYLAIEHGEYGVKPAAASEVLARRAGDCKGSANLIKSLLRHCGIDARLVWIGTRSETLTSWEEMPTPASGNHMITAAMMGDSIIYLDGTAQWAPPGYLPPSLRGAQAMIEDGDKPLLAWVPTTSAADDLDSLTATFTIEGADLRGEVSRTGRGVMRMMMLEAIAGSSPRERDRFIERYLKYPKTNVDVSDASTSTTPSSATARATVIERGSIGDLGGKLMLDLRPLRTPFAETVDTKGRTRPMRSEPMVRSTFVYKVSLPEGYAPESLPEPFTLDDPYFSASIAYDYADGVLSCRAHMQPTAQDVDIDKIAARNSSLRAIQRASDARIMLVKSEQP